MRYLLIALVLVGCATPEQRAERAMVRFGPYCEKLGYTADTDQWRNCVSAENALYTQARLRALSN